MANATIIDIAALRSSNRKLADGLISPATESVTSELVEEHAAEPIKSMDDIERISKFCIASRRFRDNMLFIVGINFGLRVSDLRVLRFSDIINPNNTKTAFLFLKRKPATQERKRRTGI